MLIKFFGNRGSVPTPGAQYSQYGGNTSCIQVVDESDGNFIVLDAGSGFRTLSPPILKSNIKNFIILLSHFHWDHIMGMPFFTPIYLKDYSFTIYGPKNSPEEMFNVLNYILAKDYFPVNFEHFKAKISFDSFGEGKKLNHANFLIEAAWSNHPCFTLSYKISLNGKKVVYLTDHEPYKTRLHPPHPQLDHYNRNADLLHARLIDYAYGCDVLIIDGEYTKSEYLTHMGWGHSSVNDAVKFGIDANAKHIVIHHHNQERLDVHLNTIYTQIVSILENSDIKVKLSFAKEGSQIEI